MHILAISGSTRKLSTNTALLRAIAVQAPPGVIIQVHDRLGDLPVFSPDNEAPPLPAPVEALIQAIEACDGVVVASPEYVRAMPGGLKNAVDWLVSGDAIADKPVALVHGSHRGEDVLAELRRVLATVTMNFAPEPFLRLPVLSESPEQIAEITAAPGPRAEIAGFLSDFTAYCKACAEAR
jgi:NAD(P)H-dependent FMN reductase